MRELYRVLTNIWEVLEDGALHRQFVEVRIKQRENTLRERRGIILSHDEVVWTTPQTQDRAQRGIPNEGPEDRVQRCEIRKKQADEFGGKYSEEKSPIASLRGGITDCLTPFALFARWLSSSANRRPTSFFSIL